MRRATTPLHNFMFEENPTTFERILITYAQGNNIVLEKEKSDLSFTNNGDGTWTASFRMTQEEANNFKVYPTSVQVRVLTTDGEALASNIFAVNIKNVLDDEVLT